MQAGAQRAPGDQLAPDRRRGTSGPGGRRVAGGRARLAGVPQQRLGGRAVLGRDGDADARRGPAGSCGRPARSTKRVAASTSSASSRTTPSIGDQLVRGDPNQHVAAPHRALQAGDGGRGRVAGGAARRTLRSRSRAPRPGCRPARRRPARRRAGAGRPRGRPRAARAARRWPARPAAARRPPRWPGRRRAGPAGRAPSGRPVAPAGSTASWTRYSPSPGGPAAQRLAQRAGDELRDVALASGSRRERQRRAVERADHGQVGAGQRERGAQQGAEQLAARAPRLQRGGEQRPQPLRCPGRADGARDTTGITCVDPAASTRADSSVKNATRVAHTHPRARSPGERLESPDARSARPGCEPAASSGAAARPGRASRTPLRRSQRLRSPSSTPSPSRCGATIVPSAIMASAVGLPAQVDHDQVERQRGQGVDGAGRGPAQVQAQHHAARAEPAQQRQRRVLRLGQGFPRPAPGRAGAAGSGGRTSR